MKIWRSPSGGFGQEKKVCYKKHSAITPIPPSLHSMRPNLEYGERTGAATKAFANCEKVKRTADQPAPKQMPALPIPRLGDSWEIYTAICASHICLSFLLQLNPVLTHKPNGYSKIHWSLNYRNLGLGEHLSSFSSLSHILCINLTSMPTEGSGNLHLLISQMGTA